MARTSSNTSNAIVSWGNTLVPSSTQAPVLISFWINVLSFTASFESFIGKDDYPANVAGWGFQRSGSTDGMVFFTRGTGALSQSLGTGWSGMGWQHCAVYIDTSTPKVVLYRNGSNVGTFSIIGNPLGTNSANLQIIVDNQVAIEGFSIFGSMNLTDANNAVAALAAGFDPLLMMKAGAGNLMFYAPLIGQGAYENDLKGGYVATVPSNSTYSPGPRLYRAAGHSTARTHSAISVIVSAANSLSFSGAATTTIDHAVAASSSVAFASAAQTPMVYNVSATNGLEFRILAQTPMAWAVGAANSFSMACSTSMTIAVTRFLAAANSLSFRVNTNSYVNPIIVSAANAFSLAASSSTRGPVYASASNAFAMATANSTIWNRVLKVSASNSLAFATANSTIWNRVWRMSAGNSLAFSATTYAKNWAVIHVSAGNSMAFSGAASGARDRVVSAASNFTLAVSATQQRDIAVSAASSLGLSASPKSNGFFAESATASFSVSTSALGVVSATEAGNALAFSNYAWATVQFPWRRTALTLDPGGGLPHS